MSITLDEAIYEKYIRPTERRPERIIGVEFEFPLLNLEKKKSICRPCRPL